MINELTKQLINKRILILGFGREGLSTCNFISRFISIENIYIADYRNPESFSIPENFNISQNFIFGENYLNQLSQYDVIIKSPGISLKEVALEEIKDKITSQTDLFIKFFSKQIIGVTGTKGKSTTSSLIHHILTFAEKRSLLAGNIGLPFFDIIDKIEDDTHIVCELSSHQLEFISTSPHIAILLNLYQEHLDHYNSYLDYQKAKYNIALYQSTEDFFIYNADDYLIENLIKENPIRSKKKTFSQIHNSNVTAFTDGGDCYSLEDNRYIKFFGKNQEKKLIGSHNEFNILAAAIACNAVGVQYTDIAKAISTFEPLHHRIEFVGTYHNIYFYNDSIATIPEASMNAVKALKNVDTLILGGHDRGIDYSNFIDFLLKSNVQNLIFIDSAGERMLKLIENERKVNNKKNILLVKSMEEAVELSVRVTKPETICLLSPAAASYGMFKNFEERGDVFKSLVMSFF